MARFPLARRRSREQIEQQAKKAAIKDSVTALVKAASANGPVMPGSRFQGGQNNLGNSAMSMVHRVSQNMAQQFNVPIADIEAELVAQGLTWGPPFPPGRPLDPLIGFRRPPRTRDFQVGENTQITPRWDRVSFKTLKAIHDQYDVSQICVRHLINDVRSLDYSWQPLPGVRDDVSEDIAKAHQFFEFPDRRLPFRAWISEYLQDVLRYDAGALYVRRSEDGTPIALEVVDGTSLIPLVDYYGRSAADEDDENPPGDGMVWPGGDTPGFLQIIQGMPWDWLTADDILYIPWNPLPESQYGQAPLEAVLMAANTDLRFQWHFLQVFTEGTIPAGFMEAPPDMSDPAQIAEWQEMWDAIMLGDQSKLNQIRWVPNGANYKPAKDITFDSEFPLYLMRRTAAAYGVTPADLGYTETVNKSTSEVQVDIQFRVGTTPVLRHVEDVVNLFVAKELKLRVRLAFDKGQETEDRVATAQAEAIYIANGVISPDEPRKRLGHEVDKEHPVPRMIINPRLGPIPILAVNSVSGKIDPDTYAPDKSQPLVPNPYIGAAGVIPVQGSPEQKAMGVANTQMQRDLLEDTTGEGPTPEMAATIAAANPPPAPTKTETSDGPPGQGADATAEPASTATGQGATPEDEQAQKEATAGVSTATGIQGADLIGHGPDDDDDEDDEDATKAIEFEVELRRWRDNTRQRLRKGRAPRRFHSSVLADDTIDLVWGHLQGARTRGEVDAVFDAALGKAGARRAGDTAAGSALRKGDGKAGQDDFDGVIAGGLAVQAQDTGRILLIQRLPDKADDDNAYARWELPGGCLDQTDPSVWDGALREWEEETGAALDENAEHAGSFLSPDGAYQCYVIQVPSEAGLDLSPQADEVADIGWWDPSSLGSDDRIRDKVQEMAPGLERFLSACPGQDMMADKNAAEIAQTPAAAGDSVRPDEDIAKDAPREPPNLREATDPAERCGTCEMFVADRRVCWGYGDWAVTPAQTCDSWQVSPTGQTVKVRAVPPGSSDGERAPGVDRALRGTGRRQLDPEVGGLPTAPGGSARKSSPAAFHRHTDKIVGHYAPLIASALEDMLPANALHAAVQAARDEYKPTKDPLAAQKRAPIPPAIAQRAIAVLNNGLSTAGKLKAVLGDLYGDAGLQGANGAAKAAQGAMLASLQSVVSELPDEYWSTWQPGWGAAAAKDADGGLADLLAERDITIKGIQGTTLDRLGNTIADSIANGDSVGATQKLVQDYVSDPTRSYLIADTEQARAMTAASMDTYVQNGVEQLDWIAEDDCCDDCQANADASPVSIDDGFPSGDVPVHPRCRCATAPHIDAGDG